MNIKINQNINSSQYNVKNNKAIAFESTNIMVRDFKPKFTPIVDLGKDFSIVGEKALYLEQAGLFSNGFWHFAEEQVIPPNHPILGNMKKFVSTEGDTFYYLPQRSKPVTGEPTVPELYICTGGDIDAAKEIIYSRPDINVIAAAWEKLVNAINTAIPKK